MVGGLVGAGGEGPRRPAERPGAVGALELPGDMHGALDELALDLSSAGWQLAVQASRRALEGVGVLAGQDGELGAHAVLDCIES